MNRRDFLRSVGIAIAAVLAKASSVGAVEAAPAEEEVPQEPCFFGASGTCLTPDSVFCEDCNTEWVQPAPEPEIEFYGDTITMVGRKADGTWDSIVIGKGVRG